MPKPKKDRAASPAAEPAMIVTQSQDSHANLFLIFSMFVKSTALALIMVIVPLLIIGAVLTYSYLHILSNHAGVSINSLVSLARRGWETKVTQTDNKKNILILGVDSLSTRDNETINTDTMMVASLDLSGGKISLFSIPRDLFLTDQKQKINAVYGAALKRGEAKPELASKQAVETLIGLPLHHVMVLEIEEVGKLIDALGGIDVTIDRSFTDAMYPKDNVNVKVVTDSASLYETISFQAGKEHMNSARALEFIRSRHSTDPVEGSDDARARRQQKVMEALMSKLESPSLMKNPGYLGDLIRLYEADFQKFLPLEEVVGVGRIFLGARHFPEFASHHLAVKDFDPDPVIYHPERFYTGQWVYLLLDPSGKQIKTVVASWVK